MDSICYRLLREEDLPQLLGLLEKVRPEIAGLRHPSLYRAICHDALAGTNVVIIVASEGQALAGFNVTVKDRKRYWQALFFRHPAVGFMILLRRSVRALVERGKTGKSADEVPEAVQACITPGPPPCSWQDSAPWIASIFITVVDEPYRTKGISEGIGRCLLNVLEDREVVLVMSRVDPGNVPSVRLSHRLGFKIHWAGPGLLISRKIGRGTESPKIKGIFPGATG